MVSPRLMSEAGTAAGAEAVVGAVPEPDAGAGAAGGAGAGVEGAHAAIRGIAVMPASLRKSRRVKGSLGVSLAMSFLAILLADFGKEPNRRTSIAQTEQY